VGQSIYALTPGSELNRQAHDRVFAGEVVDLINVPHTTPGDLEPRYYDLGLRPLRGADGTVVGMISAVIDVTERHLVDQQKDQFVAMVSHELRAPITAVKGYAQLALRSARRHNDERLSHVLSTIDRQSDRLARLIDDLLDTSRIQTGKLSLDRLPFDLRDAVQEVVSSVELTASDFIIDVKLPGEPVMVNGDRARIVQVVSNLLQNAVKYSGSSRRVIVSVEPSRTMGDVVTSVRDFGLGIPPSQQAHIFDRFYRASNVRSRQGGLGLGLSIAHTIVTSHEGRMWLKSAEDDGSTFYFSLPLA
jgi:signal transduction histidine kinase